MKAELTATFVGGLLKPDKVLSLPDQTRVKLTIETLDPKTEATAAWNALKARMLQRPIHGGERRFTREELHERD